MRNYFEILPLATEMSFKGFSIFSSAEQNHLGNFGKEG